MNKKVYKFEDIQDKIIKAVDTIADPVIQTLSPKGSNVLYEDAKGNQYVTNDGVTIAKNINVKDPVENAIIEVIKQPALQTNSIAGDGTTTTILLSKVLIKEGLKAIAEGMNRMVLKQYLEEMSDKIKANLKKLSVKIHDKKDIFRIAKISANNDEVIAKDVQRIIEVAGEEGMVFLEPHHKVDTELIEDTGFTVDCPLNEGLTLGRSFTANYQNIPVLITDKRLYYKEEAETILKVALEAGWKSVAIVARDFIGKTENFFIANHRQGVINVLLVKDPQATEKDTTSLNDLAAYLGGEVVTEKTGSLVNRVKPTQFVFAKKIVSNPMKTVIVTDSPGNKKLKELVATLKDEVEKVKENKKIKSRLANLTNGTVTVKVGGRTPLEVQERLFRYEDAVNAARAAVKDGYLVGGGLALYKSFKPEEHKNIPGIAKRFCEASIRQIAKNCGKHEEAVLENVVADKNIGYNAKTNQFEDLLTGGVIDPYKVTEMAIDNSVSIATHLLSSGYLIVNDIEDYGKNKEDREEY
jgi:chaperonin GroEL